jgi:hypothetical protein
LILSNATTRPTKGVLTSIAPSEGNWVSINDLPEEIQQAKHPSGEPIAGIDRSLLKDPEHLRVLDQWIAQAQQRAEAKRIAAERAMALSASIDATR